MEVCEETSECGKVATERTPAGRMLCSGHADEFWARREQTLRDYPDSDVPPSWFDPTYAGESWDEPV